MANTESGYKEVLAFWKSTPAMDKVTTAEMDRVRKLLENPARFKDSVSQVAQVLWDLKSLDEGQIPEKYHKDIQDLAKHAARLFSVYESNGLWPQYNGVTFRRTINQIRGLLKTAAEPMRLGKSGLFSKILKWTEDFPAIVVKAERDLKEDTDKRYINNLYRLLYDTLFDRDGLFSLIERMAKSLEIDVLLKEEQVENQEQEVPAQGKGVLHTQRSAVDTFVSEVMPKAVQAIKTQISKKKPESPEQEKAYEESISSLIREDLVEPWNNKIRVSLQKAGFKLSGNFDKDAFETYLAAQGSIAKTAEINPHQGWPEVENLDMLGVQVDGAFKAFQEAMKVYDKDPDKQRMASSIFYKILLGGSEGLYSKLKTLHSKVSKKVEEPISSQPASGDTGPEKETPQESPAKEEPPAEEGVPAEEEKVSAPLSTSRVTLPPREQWNKTALVYGDEAYILRKKGLVEGAIAIAKKAAQLNGKEPGDFRNIKDSLRGFASAEEEKKAEKYPIYELLLYSSDFTDLIERRGKTPLYNDFKNFVEDAKDVLRQIDEIPDEDLKEIMEPKQYSYGYSIEDLYESLKELVHASKQGLLSHNVVNKFSVIFKSVYQEAFDLIQTDIKLRTAFDIVKKSKENLATLKDTKSLKGKVDAISQNTQYIIKRLGNEGLVQDTPETKEDTPEQTPTETKEVQKEVPAEKAKEDTSEGVTEETKPETPEKTPEPEADTIIEELASTLASIDRGVAPPLEGLTQIIDLLKKRNQSQGEDVVRPDTLKGEYRNFLQKLYKELNTYFSSASAEDKAKFLEDFREILKDLEGLPTDFNVKGNSGWLGSIRKVLKNAFTKVINLPGVVDSVREELDKNPNRPAVPNVVKEEAKEESPTPEVDLPPEPTEPTEPEGEADATPEAEEGPSVNWGDRNLVQPRKLSKAPTSPAKTKALKLLSILSAGAGETSERALKNFQQDVRDPLLSENPDSEAILRSLQKIAQEILDDTKYKVTGTLRQDLTDYLRGLALYIPQEMEEATVLKTAREKRVPLALKASESLAAVLSKTSTGMPYVLKVPGMPYSKYLEKNDHASVKKALSSLAALHFRDNPGGYYLEEKFLNVGQLANTLFRDFMESPKQFVRDNPNYKKFPQALGRGSHSDIAIGRKMQPLPQQSTGQLDLFQA